MLKILIPTLFLFLSVKLRAQHFILGEKQMVSTAQINPSGFSFLKIGNIKQSSIDLDIPFTSLQYLIREEGKSYQMIFQKNSEGKLLAVGIDLALVQIIECRKRMVYPINACIEKRMQEDFAKDEENAFIYCLTERLNQCY